jgi:hypothetical protein
MHPSSDSLNPAKVASDGDESVRPFQINFAEAAIVDLRRRIGATQWPERETVADCNSRSATRDDASTRTLLAGGLRLAQDRSEAERPAAIYDEHRRARYSFHSCPFEECECASGNHHGWVTTRYAHLAPAHKLAAVDRLAEYRMEQEKGEARRTAGLTLVSA